MRVFRLPVAVPVGLVVAAAVGAVVWLALRSEPRAEAPEAGPTPIEGLVATEGPFVFEMVYGKCGLVSIVAPSGTTYPNEDVFCVIEFNLRNQSETSQTLDPSCQYLIGRDGSRYAQRSDVLHIDPGSRNAFLRPLAPGRLLESSALYFDVPKGTKAGEVELHSSCGSRGFLLDVVAPPREGRG